MNKELSKIINFLDAKKNYEASKLLILILKSNNLESKDFLYLGIRFINLTLFDESLSCFEIFQTFEIQKQTKIFQKL